jgi:hypothetical protein
MDGIAQIRDMDLNAICARKRNIGPLPSCRVEEKSGAAGTERLLFSSVILLKRI